MKKFQYLILVSLFSTLVSGCITVSRVQKKDARNNQFSNQLQNWFYIAHPQKIDSGIKVISDTTYDTLYHHLDSLPLGENNYFWHNEGRKEWVDSLSKLIDTSRITDIGSIDLSGDIISSGYWVSPPIYITRTIHDSIIINKVDVSQLNAYKNSLQTSRDSLNNYMIKYANKDSQSSKRLLWVIILSVALGLSGFFNIRNTFKI